MLMAQHGFVPTYRELLFACDLSAEVAVRGEIGEAGFEGRVSKRGGSHQRAWSGYERVRLFVVWYRCSVLLAAERVGTSCASEPHNNLWGDIVR